MQLEERYFSTDLFLPKIKHYFSERGDLLIILSLWGSSTYPEKNVFEEIDSIFHFLKGDKESTQPFPKLTSLSENENCLRTALLQVNKRIYEAFNHTTYVCGFEMLALHKSSSVFTCIQIGGLTVLLDRPDQSLKIKGNLLSLNSHDHLKPCFSPLPIELLGIYPDISFHPFSFPYEKKDKLFLCHRQSKIPLTWLSTESKNINTLSELASKENPHRPFWIAHLKLDD